MLGTEVVRRLPAGDAVTTLTADYLPDEDTWTWICHRCGYWVESTELQDTLDCREEHRAACKEHTEAPGNPRGDREGGGT